MKSKVDYKIVDLPHLISMSSANVIILVVVGLKEKVTFAPFDLNTNLTSLREW